MIFNKVTLFFLLLSFHCANGQITLTHNVGEELIDSGMPSCEEDESWSRVFKLSDFGVTTSEQFIIHSGKVGISKSDNGAYLGLNIFSIDSDFPNSKPVLLGSGGYNLAPSIKDTPQIIEIKLNTPIVVPAGVERILVEVRKSIDFYNPNSAAVIIAGTANDTGDSWYMGCRKYYTHILTTEMDTPVSNPNFYINVTGETFSTSNYGSNVTLTHNYCDDVIKTSQYACSWGGLKYARTFVLDDFGISTNEELILNSGQVAFSSVGNGDVKIQFNIYKIDSDFPTSYSDSDLIGSSQIIDVPYLNYGQQPRIFNIDFVNPIVVPSDVERILVEVFNLGSLSSSGFVFIAGGLQSNDLSWIKSDASGCPPFSFYESTTSDINYYINVTGKANHTTNNFEMNISNICSEFLKEFSVENKLNVASIVWDFGDLASGATNTSTDLSPYHDFSTDGAYTITAEVTAHDGSIEVLTETIDVKEPPKAYGIPNIEACEDTFGNGISSSFDTSTIQSQILGSQTDKVVVYIDGSGNEYNTLLPNPFTNTVKNRETITVRIARNDALCCYSETSFDLIVNPLPTINTIQDMVNCSNDVGGYATFNLTQQKNDLIGGNTNLEAFFTHENGNQITNLDAVTNKVVNEETIGVKVLNLVTNCYNETTFKLIVSPNPIAYHLDDLIGCDDNNDGISEYFDTAKIETSVLGNQTNMEVTYFKNDGNQLPSPLLNPYTNTTVHQEIITVRVTNSATGCFAETPLVLNTSAKPQIMQPTTLYACNEGNGLAYFDTSTIENQLIGNQSGLQIFYSDENGTELPSPLPTNYQNSIAWSQTIKVKVENELNALCFSETSFELVVNELPPINLEREYFLCDLEPSLYIAENSNYDAWKWTFEDGSVISNSFEAYLLNAGTYTLQVTELKNGISCENFFSFNLIRSVLPTITEVKIKDISDDNYIEIITSGDGDFEYAIDGFNFQDDNIFYNVEGGVYTVQVRDKKGCGFDTEEVVLVDYPKFFTPNNDGYNDYWQIKGISKYPKAQIVIFDRFGKLLQELSSNDIGWKGIYNGRILPAADYWFTVNLGDSRTFKGHFTLKR